MKTFCPLIKGECREDYVLHCHSTATPKGVSNCLLAIKLQDINGNEHDDLTEILHTISK